MAYRQAQTVDSVAHVTSKESTRCVICGGTQTWSFKYQDYNYFRCSKCSLMSTFPLPSADAIEAHYSKRFVAGNYQLLQQYADRYLVVYRGLADELSKVLSAQGESLRGKKVLDVGCFTGAFLNVLAERGADVYGLELQQAAVDIANQSLPGKVFKADVFTNDFPAGPFDIVTLLGVVEHVPEPAQLIRRAAELLKPGGVLMIQTPDSGTWMAKAMKQYWPPYAPVEHIHLFSRKSLKHVLGTLGLTTVNVKQHWKFLPIDYVFNMFQNFGPEFHRLLLPVYKFVPRAITGRSLPFYGGEMVLLARK